MVWQYSLFKMILVDCAGLGIDLLNTLLVISNIESPINCILNHFINTVEAITRHNKDTVDTTTAGLEFRDPVALGIQALVVFGCLASRRSGHVFKLTAIENFIIETLGAQLLDISRHVRLLHNQVSSTHFSQAISGERYIKRD